MLTRQVSGSNVYACSTTAVTKLKRFAATHLCVHFAPYNIKIGANVKVDDPQTIRVQDTFTNFQAKTGDSYMLVQ